MGRPLRTVLAALALASAWPAAAYEFWMMAEPFSAAVGAPVSFTLHAGEYFLGDQLPIAARQADAIQLYSKTDARNLLGELPADGSLPALTMTFPRPGTYVLAYDTLPALNTLDAGRFHAYLHEEGLDRIIRLRQEAGVAEMPGRERYRRHVKTLVRVGGKADGTYAALTGQRLEIVPSADPLAKAAGDTLSFTLFFDSKPLAGALVKAWHREGAQTLVVYSHTAQDGKVALTLPHAGAWMISVMHMIRTSDAAEADWDSFSASLTFELAPRRDGR